MRETELLYKLQEIENSIKNAELSTKEVESSRAINERIVEHKKVKDSIQRQSREVEEHESNLKKLESELQNLEQKEEELKDNMYGGKINDLKQLGIMLKEEEKFKEFDLELNEKIEKSMEQLEEMGLEIENLKKVDLEMYKSIKRMLKERKKIKEESGMKLKELIKEREDIIEKIKLESLELYNSIKSKKNNPVATLNVDICSGCHMDIPIMTISKLQKDELVTCSNCGRILYK